MKRRRLYDMKWNRTGVTSTPKWTSHRFTSHHITNKRWIQTEYKVTKKKLSNIHKKMLNITRHEGIKNQEKVEALIMYVISHLFSFILKAVLQFYVSFFSYSCQWLFTHTFPILLWSQFQEITFVLHVKKKELFTYFKCFSYIVSCKSHTCLKHLISFEFKGF